MESLDGARYFSTFELYMDKEHRKDYYLDDVVKATLFRGLFIEHVVMFIPRAKMTPITTFKIQEKAISCLDISQYHVCKSCVNYVIFPSSKSCQITIFEIMSNYHV